MKFYTLLMVISLGAASSHANCLDLKSTQRAITKGEIASGIAFAPILITNAIHELGHALTARIISGFPINIHLGVPTSAHPLVIRAVLQEHIFQTRGLTIHSLAPAGALAVMPLAKEENPSKQAAILCAGPIAGASTAILQMKGMSWINTLIDTRNISSLAKTVAKAPIRFYGKPLAALWLVNNVIDATPLRGERSDGYQIARLMGASKEKLDRLTYMRPH